MCDFENVHHSWVKVCIHCVHGCLIKVYLFKSWMKGRWCKTKIMCADWNLCTLDCPLHNAFEPLKYDWSVYLGQLSAEQRIECLLFPPHVLTVLVWMLFAMRMFALGFGPREPNRITMYVKQVSISCAVLCASWYFSCSRHHFLFIKEHQYYTNYSSLSNLLGQFMRVQNFDSECNILNQKLVSSL